MYGNETGGLQQANTSVFEGAGAAAHERLWWAGVIFVAAVSGCFFPFLILSKSHGECRITRFSAQARSSFSACAAFTGGVCLATASSLAYETSDQLSGISAWSGKVLAPAVVTFAFVIMYGTSLVLRCAGPAQSATCPSCRDVRIYNVVRYVYHAKMRVSQCGMQLFYAPPSAYQSIAAMTICDHLITTPVHDRRPCSTAGFRVLELSVGAGRPRRRIPLASIGGDFAPDTPNTTRLRTSDGDTFTTTTIAFATVDPTAEMAVPACCCAALSRRGQDVQRSSAVARDARARGELCDHRKTLHDSSCASFCVVAPLSPEAPLRQPLLSLQQPTFFGGSSDDYHSAMSEESEARSSAGIGCWHADGSLCGTIRGAEDSDGIPGATEQTLKTFGTLSRIDHEPDEENSGRRFKPAVKNAESPKFGGLKHSALFCNTKKIMDSTLRFLIFIGFSTHSLIEGIGLGSTNHVRPLGLGIGLHKGLAGVAVGLSLLELTLPFKCCVLAGIVFSSMTPLGAILGTYFLRDHLSSRPYVGVCTGAACGTLLFVALVEIFPKAFACREVAGRNYGLMILGVILAQAFSAFDS